MSQDPMSVHKYLPRRKGCVCGMNWEIGIDTYTVLIIAVQSLSCVRLSATLWIAAHHAPLSSTVSWSLFKFMSIELMMVSNHLILCWPLLWPSIFPRIRVFSNELARHIRWPNTGASASVLPMNIQGWFPLGLTGLISMQSKELSRVFSSTIVQSINSLALSFLQSPALTSIHDYWKNHSFD